MAKNWYRTQDGLADYKFDFHQNWWSGNYTIYIDRQPSYGGRDTSLHATHRLVDGGRYYVCWTDPITNAEDARQIAAMWADRTQQYIKTGQRF